MRDAYHEELDALTDQLVEMTRLVGSAISRASTALLDADLTLAESVIAADDAVDALRDDLDAPGVRPAGPSAAGGQRPAHHRHQPADERRPGADGRPGPARVGVRRADRGQPAPTIGAVDALLPGSWPSSACSSAPARCWRSGPASGLSRRSTWPRRRRCCRPARPTCSRCCARRRWCWTPRTRWSEPARRRTPWAWSARSGCWWTTCSSWSRRCAATARSARPSWSCRAGRSAGRPSPSSPGWRPLGSTLVLAAGRGPHRGAPGGRRPAGLRRERQPRAQDPGRRDVAARRGAAGRRRRPRGGTPVRRPDAARGGAAVRLVQDVIELSRLQGHDPLRARPTLVSLDDVVADAVDRCRLDRRGARRSRWSAAGRAGLKVMGDVTAAGDRAGQPGRQRRPLRPRGHAGSRSRSTGRRGPTATSPRSA